MTILAQAMLEMWFRDLRVLVTVSDASRAAGRAGYAWATQAARLVVRSVPVVCRWAFLADGSRVVCERSA